MKVLLLSSAFSGLTQRVLRELVLLNHIVEQHYECSEPHLLRQLERFSPDLIICPFLTWRIPEEVWRRYPCLVVHPGIEGDRGPSSLDWAISQGADEWGVTLLQAAAEMDAGEIWGTRLFPMRRASKLSVYKREVSSAAVVLIKQALLDANDRDFAPRPLDYANPKVKGKLMPNMRQDDRRIDWRSDSSREIVDKINASDTSPGVADSVVGSNGRAFPVHLYGAVHEHSLRGRPGDIIAVHEGAACYATVDGAVWIRQLKCKDHPQLPPIKLPATTVLQGFLDPAALQSLPPPRDTRVIDEIVVERRGEAAYLYFNFYNGALSTGQCLALKHRLAELKAGDAKIIVLMGGQDFWNNGIHLNCIEAAEAPGLESWENINAIDDLVLEIIDTPRQVTIAALRNNAGAGGAIMALACDKVVVREGVVLNPHYKNMGLYGSEYWTYLLPKRIGQEAATRVTTACQPMLAGEAVALGFADLQLCEDWDSYHVKLENYVLSFGRHTDIDQFLQQKVLQRTEDERLCPLHDYRSRELVEMRKSFDDPRSDYHQARRAFVYKQKPPQPTKAPKKSRSTKEASPA